MGFLKNIHDQLFTVGRISRHILSDATHTRTLGLDELPERHRLGQLQPRVGFVLAMYNSLAAIAREHSELSADELLGLMLWTRFRTPSPTAVASPEALVAETLAWMRRDIPVWPSLDLKQKFVRTCAYALAVEERLLHPEMPASDHDSLRDIAVAEGYLLAKTVIDEVAWNLPHRG